MTNLLSELQVPGGFKISEAEMRKNLNFAQVNHHANCYFQRVFCQDDYTIILIVDLYDDRYPTKTVTNDAEYVVQRAYAGQGDHPMIYCDSEGRWDELMHDKGVFIDFRSLGGVETIDEAIPSLRRVRGEEEILNQTQTP